MKSKLHRFICLASISLVYSMGGVLQEACAQSQTIMGIDAMVILHQGLFRNATPNDGVNTFQFGPIQTAAGTLGRYHSFRFVVPDGIVGGIHHFGRLYSDSPETFNGASYSPIVPITPNHFAVLDRAVFGALFDPDEYQIEVKFKPNAAPFPLPNQAASFNIVLEQVDGFMPDEEVGALKRANEKFIYEIGNAQNPINTWYASAPQDADGFATWTVPISAPSSGLRGFYHNRGDGLFRFDHVVTGGGRVFNPTTSMYEDVLDGPDFDAFGDPASDLDVPNGLAVLGIESSFADLASDLNIEVRSVLVKKIHPDPSIVIRLDENSGITHRFGTALAYNEGNPAPVSRPQDSAINVGDVFPFSPIATDQISRFDQNGMLDYLSINPREPLFAQEGYSFLLRGAPSGHTFNGDNALVVVSARLSELLTTSGVAQEMTIVLKDLDGNDTPADAVGADEYTYNLPMNIFNTETFTTVAIPLSAFTLSPFVPTTAALPGSGPFGFTNPGDGSSTDFNLYEFGVLVPPGGGLLRLDLDYLDVRVPIPEPSAGGMLLPVLALLGISHMRCLWSFLRFA